MELTKEHFDEAVKGLATQASVDELSQTVENIAAAVSRNTASLDTLLTSQKDKAEEKTVSAARFDRLEKWAEEVGQKLNIKLEL